MPREVTRFCCIAARMSAMVASTTENGGWAEETVESKKWKVKSKK
jgi:hypothetical protein